MSWVLQTQPLPQGAYLLIQERRSCWGTSGKREDFVLAVVVRETNMFPPLCWSDHPEFMQARRDWADDCAAWEKARRCRLEKQSGWWRLFSELMELVRTLGCGTRGSGWGCATWALAPATGPVFSQRGTGLFLQSVHPIRRAQNLNFKCEILAVTRSPGNCQARNVCENNLVMF